MRSGAIARVATLLLAAASCRSDARDPESRERVDRDGPLDRESELKATTPSDTEIVLTRRFAAPRETVFAALTKAEHLEKWMEAQGMTLVSCEVDLRVGGTLRHVYQRPSGRRIEVRGTYDAVDPPRRFAYTETYDFSPLEVKVTTTLDAKDGGTEFKQMLRYSSKRERDEDFEGVKTSSAEAYAKLERYLAGIGR